MENRIDAYRIFIVTSDCGDYIKGLADNQSFLTLISHRRMLNDIYNRKILELAGNIPRLGKLPHSDGSAVAHSRLCGSTVKVELCVDKGEIVDFAHEVRACALGQAAASLMASHIVGASSADMRELRNIMRKMLKEKGPPPEGPWEAFAILAPIRDFPARHASTLLTFDAVVDALNQAENAARANS